MSETPPAPDLPPGQPAIVLVAPQLPENIGAAARAMANFGLADLRLVNPREAWPNEKATASASGADHVIGAARVFDTLEAAIGDLTFVYATTARAREAAKAVVGPREAAATARAKLAGHNRVGILFGRERTGLSNEEVALADAILTLPVEPTFASLNIAQAVLIVAYEWRISDAAVLPFGGSVPPQATRAELIGLFDHLDKALDEAGFYRPPERRPHIMLALRAALQRAGLTEQEVRTLRGVIAALERRPTRPHVLPDGTVSTARGPE